MATQKPSIPAGTRDFGPDEMIKRTWIFDTIRGVFRTHGFLPLETPAMENLSTLLGKYGEEGDKLLFRIQNSGEKSALPPEKGLRYDLTVPFARYVVQHRNDITFPFRRYQVQPVWRADRPQKGRYREFYQCDVDIIGSRSLLNEVELVQIVEKVFSALNINVLLKINNRKILFGIAETIGRADRMIDLTVAIDKLEKIGIDKVNEELAEKGFSAEAIQKLQPILALSGTNREKLAQLSGVLKNSETGLLGITEVTDILNYTDSLGVSLDIELDLSLARGLNYYTGAIFEVKAKDYPIGSICGGGRYDDLTGIFGMPDTSGVGISFGADRIYDVLAGLDLYPRDAMQSTRALFINFGGEAELSSMLLVNELRNKNIAVELYPDASKMKKQMDYANRRAIPHVVLIGENEIVTQTATLKNMATGEQENVPFGQLADRLRG